MRAYGKNKSYNVAFETWLSCDTDPELSALPDPPPKNIRHNIRVIQIAGYHQHYDVFGLIAAGYQQLAYIDPVSTTGLSDRWTEAVQYVTQSGEANCLMKADSGPLIARILAINVTLYSSWTPPVSILSAPLELSIPVS